MELFYYPSPHGNFGDDLNLWLWDEIMPGWREIMPDHWLIGVGTLINHYLPQGRPKLVMGSGFGYGKLPDAAQMAECTFVAVRGPKTAAMLGLPPERAIVDPAVLIADLPAFQNIPKSGRPIFVPHHKSVRRYDWPAICARAGIDYLSPEGDAREVMRRIAAAPLVIAESMHAVILADAFGTPWHAVSVAPQFNPWKFEDWAESLRIPLTIHSLFGELDDLRRRFGGRARPAEPAAGAAQEGPAPIPQSTFAMRHVRIFWAARRLRRLAATPGQLSDRAILAEAKARYRAAIAPIVMQAAA